MRKYHKEVKGQYTHITGQSWGKHVTQAIATRDTLFLFYKFTAQDYINRYVEPFMTGAHMATCKKDTQYPYPKKVIGNVQNSSWAQASVSGHAQVLISALPTSMAVPKLQSTLPG